MDTVIASRAGEEFRDDVRKRLAHDAAHYRLFEPRWLNRACVRRAQGSARWLSAGRIVSAGSAHSRRLAVGSSRLWTSDARSGEPESLLTQMRLPGKLPE